MVLRAIQALPGAPLPAVLQQLPGRRAVGKRRDIADIIPGAGNNNGPSANGRTSPTSIPVLETTTTTTPVAHVESVCMNGQGQPGDTLEKSVDPTTDLSLPLLRARVCLQTYARGQVRRKRTIDRYPYILPKIPCRQTVHNFSKMRVGFHLFQKCDKISKQTLINPYHSPPRPHPQEDPLHPVLPGDRFISIEGRKMLVDVEGRSVNGPENVLHLEHVPDHRLIALQTLGRE